MTTEPRTSRSRLKHPARDARRLTLAGSCLALVAVTGWVQARTPPAVATTVVVQPPVADSPSGLIASTTRAAPAPTGRPASSSHGS